MFRVTVDNVFGFAYWMWNEIFGRRVPIPTTTNTILLKSATALAADIRNGNLSSLSIVEAFITRAEAVNVLLNFIADRNYEEARRMAQEYDEMTEDLKTRLPLVGVPFSCKESIAVTGMRHTMGMISRQNIRAEVDADVVEKLKAAGAIPLFTTNLPELAMFWTTDNRVYGTTKNPYDTRRTVGGSSGGEGAANATASIPFGIGSDIGGSIRMPSAFNGIFGHKPSPGIVSNRGQIPEVGGALQDYWCTGPMCRYAEDLATVCSVLGVEVDRPLPRSINFYYVDGGTVELASQLHSDVRECLKKVVQYLESSGNYVSNASSLAKSMRWSYHIWSNKMSAGPSYADLLGIDGGFWELFKWLFRRSNHTLPSIGLALSRPVLDEKYDAMCQKLEDDLRYLLGENGVFLYPTHPTLAPFLTQAILMPYNFAYSAIFNALKLPATHVPCGLNIDGLPVGIQIVARRDSLVLAVAKVLESEFGGWQQA